jgi:hypothetical protein
MDVPTHEQLIESIDAFQARHPKIGDARLGREATGEPGLIQRLRRGSSPTLAVLNRLKDFMSAKDAEVVREEAVADHAASDTGDGAAASCGKAGEVSAAQVAA